VAKFATLVVRQWLTFDGNSNFFTEDRHANLHLGKTQLGKPWIIPEPRTAGWIWIRVRDWKVDPEEIPKILERMNRGQGAEETNTEGWSVNETRCSTFNAASVPAHPLSSLPRELLWLPMGGTCRPRPARGAHEKVNRPRPLHPMVSGRDSSGAARLQLRADEILKKAGFCY